MLVAIVARLVLPVVCNALVAAPVGKTEEITFVFTLPEASTEIGVKLPAFTPAISVLDVGAVAPLVPTLGLDALIVPDIGKGFEADTPTRLPATIIPISVAEVGAVVPVVPTLGLEAVIDPEIGSGLVEETPCSLPVLSIIPISVLDVGAVVLLVPTEAFELEPPAEAGYCM